VKGGFFDDKPYILCFHGDAFVLDKSLLHSIMSFSNIPYLRLKVSSLCLIALNAPHSENANHMQHIIGVRKGLRG